MSEWIGVHEQLPNEMQWVVFASFYSWCDQKAEIDSVVAGQFWNGSFHPNTDGLGAINYDGGACITLVMNPTHWMPIPDAPKD